MIKGSGAYVGAGNRVGLGAFGANRGARCAFGVDYFGHTSLTDFRSWAWLLKAWQGTPMLFGVPLLPGAASSDFVQLASDLNTYGYATTSALRLGWEMNTYGQFQWTPPTTAPAAFKARYLLAAAPIRKQLPHVQLVWNVNLGNPDPTPWYPGDAWVDAIAVDAYDAKWAAPGATPAQRWDFVLHQDHGLAWIRDFAKAHGKPLMIPEWGLDIPADDGGGGGGDDPGFIDSMLNWCADPTNNVTAQAYYSADTHQLERFPLSLARYRARRGA